MFGLFKTKEVDREKVKAFCNWFVENENRVTLSVVNASKDRDFMNLVLNEVEAELAKVYRDGFKDNIEFEYGFDPLDNTFTLNLFHLNNKFLKEATTQIADHLNVRLMGHWTVNSME